MNTFLNALPIVAAIAIVAAIPATFAGLAALARRDARQAAAMNEWNAPFAEIIEAGQRDPLDAANPVDTIDLSAPLLFDELTALNPVRLDWQPASFTQEWHAIGQLQRDLGETREIEKVAA